MDGFSSRCLRVSLINSTTSRQSKLPVEGRLQQPTLDLLSGSDVQFKREHRLDIALVKNHDIALIFLPAADIPTFVAEGRVDLGITGRDQVAEYECENSPSETSGVEEVLDLGFGSCKLQVQVPEVGKYSDVRELIGERIATSFKGLTDKFFDELEAQELEGQSATTNGSAVGGQSKRRTNVRTLGGSVETACTLGVADGIVDLVGKSLSITTLAQIALEMLTDECRVR